MNKLVEIRHFHLFCGLGGGAKGFNAGRAEVAGLEARFRCIGGIDVDAGAIQDFDALAGVKGTVLDLFDREQYRAFHGKQPGPDWKEATPQDIQRAAGNERPHIVFLSAPCKGFSGLLSETRSKTGKYKALNRLTVRGVWLMLEAFQDDPPELILFENVPRIANRGRHLVDQIRGLLEGYGYAVAETTHDCGEIGGLGQSRKRFLLVARHTGKVRPFLYEPAKRPLCSIGDVLGRFPAPGDVLGGPMHRIPALQWKTWVRLAFVEAGSDWRSLNRLRIKGGKLRDYLLVPERFNGYLGVNPWDASMGTVISESRPTNGRFSVADPRFSGHEYGQFGVKRWGETSNTVSGGCTPGQGRYSVADPRCTNWRPDASPSKYSVAPWDGNAKTITGSQQVASGALSVADPRLDGTRMNNVFRIVRWTDASPAVTGGTGPTAGGLAVADPRPGWGAKRDVFNRGQNHYGVMAWDDHTGAIPARCQQDKGPWSVADPRLPKPEDKVVAKIISLDETWHRPFTTLELAALQGLVDPEERFLLGGKSDTAWRERIGNAVPPPAAQAIASEMGRTLLLAWSGATFALGATPVWVRELAIALSVAQQGERQ